MPGFPSSQAPVLCFRAVPRPDQARRLNPSTEPTERGFSHTSPGHIITGTGWGRFL